MNRRSTAFERHPKTTLTILLMVVLLVFMCLAEWGLRLFYESRWEFLGRSWAERSVRLREMPPLFKEKPAPGVEFRMDADGFVMPSLVHDDPDATLLFLGGSTTACRAVTEEKRFPYLAGRQLETATGMKINSINSGVVGNNSMHSNIALLAKGLPKKPDVAVLMHGINDLVILLYEKTYWNNSPTRSIVVTEPQTFKDKCRAIVLMIKDMTFPYLYKVVRGAATAAMSLGAQSEPDEFAHLRGQRLEFSTDDLTAQFEKSLRTFLGMCRANGIVPVLMTQASRFQEKPDQDVAEIVARKATESFGISYDDFRKMYEAFNATTIRVAAEEGVLLVDLAHDIPQDTTAIYDLVHLNDAGSEKVAGIVTNALEPVVKGLAK